MIRRSTTVLGTLGTRGRMNTHLRATHQARIGVVRGYLLASVANLAGMAALWYLGEHKFFQGYDPGFEGTLVLLFLVGSLWAGVAVFLTLRAFVEFARSLAVPPIWMAFMLSVSTLPISLVVNHPGYTINPVGNFFGGRPPAYEVMLVEYFILTFISGLALVSVSRSARFATTAVTFTAWYVLAIFYLVQLPVKGWLPYR